jgi:hypothetical protein
MGYGTRDGGIRTFWPDDTDTEMYIPTDFWHGSPPIMADLLQKIYEKWADAALTQIQITSEHIHTDCLGYDLYDPGDYTTFIKITRLQGA